ncbi:nuclear transport factor 2 family protein [Cobetia sp. 1AS1]|uniref:nuclear transport factor 2 family protein n=1 Tax=Cobetia sp. 1AS1 TaxID=3040016 RepID=UPI00244A4CDC|nr:nuclear transport factor 2 family protein [Cobetia sp. 1AS1]MDH2296258.1 nuclear transport factor 2 family protein [Cobetia sp. 1AS1]
MQSLPDEMSPALTRVCRLYEKLDKTSTELLKSVYSDDIVFRDPLHEVRGLTALNAYFSGLYMNVAAIDFVFHHPLGPMQAQDAGPADEGNADEGNEQGLAWLSWTMTYRHPRLNGGKDISVQGASRLEFRDGKVIQHRDFFDAGELLYEQVPVLRNVIGLLKRRMD